LSPTFRKKPHFGCELITYLLGSLLSKKRKDSMNYEEYLSTTYETQYECDLSADVPIGDVFELINSARSKDRLTKRPYERVKGARSGWQVHKFGGSSFTSPVCYSFVGGLIDSFPAKNLIVVSALSGITNLLYSICTKAEKGSVLDSQEWKTLEFRVSEAIISCLGNTLAREKEIQRLNNDLIYLASLFSFIPTASLKDRQAITSVVVGFGENFFCSSPHTDNALRIPTCCCVYGCSRCSRCPASSR